MTVRRPATFAMVTAVILGAGGARAEECPSGVELEPEMCGTDKNAACPAGPVWWDAACGQTWCGSAWASGGVRDTDWYEFTALDTDGGGTRIITATVVSEVPTVVFIVGGGCTPSIVATGCAEGGEVLEVAEAELEAPADYLVFVAAGSCEGGILEGFPCAGEASQYVLTIGCATPACPADLDGDGAVRVSDLVALILSWGPCDGPVHCPADLNGDTVVDVDDLIELVVGWGTCG